ncbi:MAG: hypothetical protein HGA31_03885 [Candidatus Moranbacteria bacterium]|nr:hypothetical protein [Candidatus Moranbacteria bacterium]
MSVKSFCTAVFLGVLALMPATVARAAAPVIAEVTPVPTPTSDTTPEYTFSSTQNGIIVFSGEGGCDSDTTAAVAGNNTVTFNTLSQGTHAGCVVSVFNDSLESSNDLAISSFTIDTIAPTVSQVTTVPTPTSDTTPNYTFSSSEAGTISYSGDCSSATTSAVSGSNTVTFNTLSQGAHSNCRITVTDIAGNPSSQLTVSSFTIDTAGPAVNITAPLDGDSVTGFDVITFSDNETTAPRCSIDGTNWSVCVSGVTTLSDISGFAALPADTFTLSLMDTDPAGNTGTDSETGIIKTTPPVVDSTPPVRSGGSPSGNLAFDTIQATLILATDENATCRYSTVSGTTYESMTDTFDTTGTTTHSEIVTGLASGTDHRFFVRCIDADTNANFDDYEIAFSVASGSSAGDGGSDDDDGDKKKNVTKREVSQSVKNVSRGDVLIQRGKHFSKNSGVVLYFGKPGGGYYPPVMIRTDADGRFAVSYNVRKPVGSYRWYAIDLKTGWKSKTLTYKVK